MKKIELHVPGSADYAAMYTYFLDLSKEVPIEKRPTVIVSPRRRVRLYVRP